MENKAILEKTEKVTLDGAEIEIKGEVYEDPITTTKVQNFHTKITFTEEGQPWGVGMQVFENKLNEEQLQKELDFRVRHINNFKDESSQ